MRNGSVGVGGKESAGVCRGRRSWSGLCMSFGMPSIRLGRDLIYCVLCENSLHYQTQVKLR